MRLKSLLRLKLTFPGDWERFGVDPLSRKACLSPWLSIPRVTAIEPATLDPFQSHVPPSCALLHASLAALTPRLRARYCPLNRSNCLELLLFWRALVGHAIYFTCHIFHEWPSRPARLHSKPRQCAGAVRPPHQLVRLFEGDGVADRNALFCHEDDPAAAPPGNIPVHYNHPLSRGATFTDFRSIVAEMVQTDATD